jgi:diaminopimelate decarboxylase
MHRYLVALIAPLMLGPLLVMGLVALAAGAPPNQNAMIMRAKLYKANELKSPKIALIGGSNVFYGFRAEQIERETGVRLEYLDIGGGLAVTYDAAERAVDVKQFGQVISALVGGAGLKIILEPGRFLVGNAGVLLTRVLYRKRSGGKEFIITDAGMTDLLRPSHYNAFHRIEAVNPSGRTTVADVVGPICESGDFLALDRQIDDAQPGDLLAVQSTGAYGFVMASNYNSRPRPAEVLVDGDKFAVITERESYEDLVRKEIPPAWRSAQ